MSARLVPPEEWVRRVLGAAENLHATLRTLKDFIPGKPAEYWNGLLQRPDTTDSVQRIGETMYALAMLEHAWNPDHHAIHTGGRPLGSVVSVSGWQDSAGCMQGLSLLQGALDSLLTHWGVEHQLPKSPISWRLGVDLTPNATTEVPERLLHNLGVAIERLRIILAKEDGQLGIGATSGYECLSVRILDRLTGELLPNTSWHVPERNDQRIAIAVCDATGMTPERWDRLSKDERTPWLHKTLKALEKQPTPNVWIEGEDLPSHRSDLAGGSGKQSETAPAVNATEPTRPVRPNGDASVALLRVFTNGLADDRIEKASRLLADDELTVNEKLTKIDALMPFPLTASAERLGEMLGVTKQAVLKTEWWIQNRKGEKDNEIGRRRAGHKERARRYEPPGTKDDDDAR